MGFEKADIIEMRNGGYKNRFLVTAHSQVGYVLQNEYSGSRVNLPRKAVDGNFDLIGKLVTFYDYGKYKGRRKRGKK